MANRSKASSSMPQNVKAKAKMQSKCKGAKCRESQSKSE